MAKAVAELFREDPSLVNHRTVAICLLAFSGFMRISKLVDTQVKHLKFATEHLEITIPKPKMDQLR